MKYSTKSLKTYLDDLAAKSPAPGGGSAAALAGALGCALLSMVCNFTIGKDKYRRVEKEVREILRQAGLLRKRFLSLVDLDVKAYSMVFNARGGNPEVYQRKLIGATEVPLEICKLAVEGYGLCPLLRKIANKYLVSDCLVAQELLKSCFKSARFNVIINFYNIKDEKFVSQAKKTIAALSKSI